MNLSYKCLILLLFFTQDCEEKREQRSERAGHLEVFCVHELILSLFIQTPEITESSSLWSQKESLNADFNVS